MDEERGSQKEIARRYHDRVDAAHARNPRRRLRFWLSCCLFAGGLAAIYFGQERTPPAFFNTGPLSRHHRPLENDCVACHQPESLGAGSLAPARFVEVLRDRFRHGAPSFKRIDQACLACHVQHDFHEPNVVENASCSACHEEHQGPAAMRAVTTLDCAACHADRATMQASAQLGKQIPPSHFRLNPKVAGAPGPQQVILNLPRPLEGYTNAFRSFDDGHPAFQLHRENVRESDALRFNHQRHLEGPDIPPMRDGKKLDCASCHQAEPNGRYMRRVNFEAHCQQCHSLQFDVKNPAFQLPHGDASLVRTFLRTLPAQYGEFARREKKMTNESQVAQFTTQQVRQLQTQFGSGAELERAVFFEKNPYKASQKSDPATRANYAGCAYCHEVKQTGGGAFPTVEIAPPVMVDRWLPHAHFSHARHAGVISCRECHVAATSSRLTSDVLIPRKETCVSCHSETASPLKQASAECSTCHTYHAPDSRVASPPAADAAAFKRMLLGATARSSSSDSAPAVME